MASKVTPLYAETLILLNLWALSKTPATRPKFVDSNPKDKDSKNAKTYIKALSDLVEIGAVSKTTKGKKTVLYDITPSGKAKLAEGLANENFAFSTAIGPKKTNALLKWFRQESLSKSAASFQTSAEASNGQANGDRNGNAAKISSYEEFTKTALSTYDQLNQDYNLDDLVPIYRIRRELGDRLSRQNFNSWLLEVQANDLVQLMGGELPNVTADQLEDSVAIPGGGTRFYVKRLQPA